MVQLIDKRASLLRGNLCPQQCITLTEQGHDSRTATCFCQRAKLTSLRKELVVLSPVHKSYRLRRGFQQSRQCLTDLRLPSPKMKRA